jgi:hypothetical protein
MAAPGKATCPGCGTQIAAGKAGDRKRCGLCGVVWTVGGNSKRRGTRSTRTRREEQFKSHRDALRRADEERAAPIDRRVARMIDRYVNEPARPGRCHGCDRPCSGTVCRDCQ